MSLSPGSFSTSSSLSLSPQEHGQFTAYVNHQVLCLQRMHQELQNAFTIQKGRTLDLENELKNIKEQIKSIMEKIAKLQKISAKSTDDRAKLKKIVDELEEAVKKLGDEQKEEIVIIKTTIESLRTSIETQSNGRAGGARGGPLDIPPNFAEMIHALDQQMITYDLKLAETDLRFQILESTNYDGKIIWKIKDFKRRQNDAKRGAAMSIYSQPFYTSRYGYKLCLRVYLNGDGIGKNTHISLFIVLMKGDYDALLPFPFAQKVTLYLLDQSPRRRHLTDTFKPDPTSSSFKRPTSDMNIASGCPLFVSHDTLNNGDYVVDDTIFFEAVIDTTDLEDF